jgi:hypothetical protein
MLNYEIEKKIQIKKLTKEKKKELASNMKGEKNIGVKLKKKILETILKKSKE